MQISLSKFYLVGFTMFAFASSQNVQIALFLFMSLVCVFRLQYASDFDVSDFKWQYIFLLVCVFAYNIFVYYFHTDYADLRQLLAGLKVFLIPISISFFSYSFRRRDYSAKFVSVLKYFKIVLLIYAFFAIYGFISGEGRSTGGLGHSIDVAMFLSLIYLVIEPGLNRIWKIIFYLTLMLLGSTTVIFVMFFLLVLKFRTNILSKLILASVVACVFMIYSEYYRGKSFFNIDINSIDRFQISNSYLDYIIKNFNFIDYVFGLGLGQRLDGFSDLNQDVIEGWFLVSFSENGVYSYGTHNDFLRIIFDYGLVGVFLIFLFVKKYFGWNYFFALFVFSLTNTVFYSTHVIFALGISYILIRSHSSLFFSSSPRVTS